MEGVGEVGMVVRLMVKEFMRKLGRSEVGFESENL